MAVAKGATMTVHDTALLISPSVTMSPSLDGCGKIFQIVHQVTLRYRSGLVHSDARSVQANLIKRRQERSGYSTALVGLIR